MRIGVMIEGQEGLTWERWFRIADRVEGLGLDSLWRSDHFVSLGGDPQRPALECWTSLTALAQRTQRLRFGPLVSPMTFRHPALLARMAAAVDGLSNGRLVVGVGAGWNEAEHRMFGIPMPPVGERMDRLEEGITVLKALWSGGPVDFDGRFYSLRGAVAFPRPVQTPRPPILIGGDGEVRLLRIVAREADEWNSHARDQDIYRRKLARLEEHCAAAGRNLAIIRRSWMGGVLIGRDQAELLERGRWLRAFLRLDQGDPDQAPAMLRQRGWLAGTPAEVAKQLQGWQAVGIQRVVLQWFDLDNIDGLELLAEVQSA